MFVPSTYMLKQYVDVDQTSIKGTYHAANFHGIMSEFPCIIEVDVVNTQAETLSEEQNCVWTVIVNENGRIVKQHTTINTQTLHLVIAVPGSSTQPFVSPPLEVISLRERTCRVSWFGVHESAPLNLPPVNVAGLQYFSEIIGWLQDEHAIYVYEDRVLQFNAMQSMVLPYTAARFRDINASVTRESCHTALLSRQRCQLRPGTRTYARKSPFFQMFTPTSQCFFAVPEPVRLVIKPCCTEFCDASPQYCHIAFICVNPSPVLAVCIFFVSCPTSPWVGMV